MAKSAAAARAAAAHAVRDARGITAERVTVAPWREVMAGSRRANGEDSCVATDGCATPIGSLEAESPWSTGAVSAKTRNARSHRAHRPTCARNAVRSSGVSVRRQNDGNSFLASKQFIVLPDSDARRKFAPPAAASPDGRETRES